MKLPRDLTGDDLAKGLRRLRYEPVRRSGSHIIFRTDEPRAHSITVPDHKPIKVGTLSAILHELALQRQTTVEDILVAMKLA